MIFHFLIINQLEFVVFKRTLLVSTLALISSQTFAASYANMMDNYQTGVVITDAALAGNVAGIAIQNNEYEASLQAAYFHRSGLRAAPILANIGIRHSLASTVYYDYGLQGIYKHYFQKSGTVVKSPYSLGVYVGLQYQPNEHIQVFAQTLPYNYHRQSTDTRLHGFFEDANIGMKYFFK